MRYFTWKLSHELVSDILWLIVGILLKLKLTIENYLKMVTTKINETIRHLRKLQNLLLRTALIAIYKAFAWRHLDYGDILYDQSYNLLFHQKVDAIQYRVCLAITGGKRCTSRENIYQELQQLTKYLILTLVFMWNSTQREKFNICFSRVFY